MSASLYDEALVKKLKNWIKDDSLTITSPSETRRLFQYQADKNNDNPIELPLITLRKDNTTTILSTNKKPLSFDGWRNDSVAFKDSLDRRNGKTNQLNAIPIQLNYQIDIYTRYQAEAEEYLRNFVFNIINYPKLEIEIPYNNSDIKAYANIRLVPDIIDNSDIPERLIAGQFTRFTISIYIDDAYLWNYRTKDNVFIDLDSKVIAKLETEINQEIQDKDNK